jgi:hypothetical protein
MTATKKIGKGKKATTAKGRKTKAKKSEAVEVVPTPEPEDDDFEVKVDLAPKPTKGKKRKTEDLTDVVSAVDIEAPPPKRRVTRARASSVAANDTVIAADESSLLAPNPIGRKKGRQSTRKVSTASVASLRAPVPNDEELDAALEADLERMTDEEPQASTAKTSRQSRAAKADHAMFGTEPIEIDEAAIDAELKEMEAASKPLPMAKGAAKGKQPRKPSAKQQAAAAKKAAEAEAAAQRTAEEEDEASQQIAMELEHSISIQHSSPISQPIVQPKRQRATSRQPSRHMPERRTRGSVMSLDDSKSSLADDQGNLIMDGNEDSGNDTDASQSTVVRGGQTRRGSTMNNGKGKAASRNIEKIVRKAPTAKFPHLAVPGVPDHEEDASMIEERFYTPAPEPHIPVVEDHPLPEVPKPKAAKARGRPPKAAPATALGGEQANAEVDSAGEVPTLIPAKAHKVKVATPHRSPTPPPKQRTPSQSPQSSDAENHPPSTKPSASIRKAVTPHANTTRVPLAATTPSMSPSKRNIIAGLVTTHPWTSVHLDALFLKSPGSENAPGTGLFGAVLDKAKNGDLTSPEKKMTVGEWIKYNAEMAEEKLRSECERMVGRFESEGTRAMRALEGIECIE